MNQQVRLAVLHKSRLIRECLAAVLGKPPFQIVDLNPSQDIVSQLEEEQVQIVILDLSLPDHQAIDMARDISARCQSCRIIALVSASCQRMLAECLAAGCHAWVHEESSLHELQQALEDVRLGRSFCSPTLLDTVLSQFTKLARDAPPRQPPPAIRLTPRELEVLDLVSRHFSNKEIARKLSVSQYTVKNHVHKILDKLSVESRHAAVEYARGQRWLLNIRSSKRGNFDVRDP